jgi:hypothetical protein
VSRAGKSTISEALLAKMRAEGLPVAYVEQVINAMQLILFFCQYWRDDIRNISNERIIYLELKMSGCMKTGSLSKHHAKSAP